MENYGLSITRLKTLKSKDESEKDSLEKKYKKKKLTCTGFFISFRGKIKEINNE